MTLGNTGLILIGTTSDPLSRFAQDWTCTYECVFLFCEWIKIAMPPLPSLEIGNWKLEIFSLWISFLFSLNVAKKKMGHGVDPSHGVA